MRERGCFLPTILTQPRRPYRMRDRCAVPRTLFQCVCTQHRNRIGRLSPFSEYAPSASRFKPDRSLQSKVNPLPGRVFKKAVFRSLRLGVSASYWTTSSLTFAIPRPTIPSVSAAEYETSTSRPGTNGPRSLTRTVTDRPVATFVTRNRVPNGNVR